VANRIIFFRGAAGVSYTAGAGIWVSISQDNVSWTDVINVYSTTVSNYYASGNFRYIKIKVVTGGTAYTQRFYELQVFPTVSISGDTLLTRQGETADKSVALIWGTNAALTYIVGLKR
jgi:hypothetical protein